MNKQKMQYMKKANNYAKVIRTEILFTPLLIVVPVIVGILLIHDWYCRGFSMNNSAFNGELILGIIILVGNIVFDIPFIKSLKTIRKQSFYFTNFKS
jgi:hypothetical protein